MAAKSTLAVGEKVTLDDPRLFNMNDLATILGVDRSTIRRMKFQGFRMPLGRASVAAAHAFHRSLEVAAK